MQDCFAYKSKKCIALKRKKCEGCVFYKPRTLHEIDIEKAKLRIAGLDVSIRDYVLSKYCMASLEVNNNGNQTTSATN